MNGDDITTERLEAAGFTGDHDWRYAPLAHGRDDGFQLGVRAGGSCYLSLGVGCPETGLPGVESWEELRELCRLLGVPVREVV